MGTVWETGYSWFGKLWASTTGKHLVISLIVWKSSHCSWLMEEHQGTVFPCRLARDSLTRSATCSSIFKLNSMFNSRGDKVLWAKMSPISYFSLLVFSLIACLIKADIDVARRSVVRKVEMFCLEESSIRCSVNRFANL